MPTYRVPIDYGGGASPAYWPEKPSDQHDVLIATYSYPTNTVTLNTTFIWDDRPDDVEVVDEDDAGDFPGDGADEGDDADDADGEEYVCDECGDTFDSRMALVGHSNAHSDE